MNYYIKERHNPQIGKPYYTAMGKLSTNKAEKIENSLYGTNIMLPYKTEKDYNDAIEKLKKDGYTVHQ